MLSCKTPVPHRLLLALLWPRYVLAATDCVCTRFQQAEPTDITSSISVQSNIFTGTAFWNIPVKLAYSQIFFFKLEQRAEGYHHHRFLRINQLSIYHWYVAIMNSTNFWVICSVIRDDPSSQDHQKKKKKFLHYFLGNDLQKHVFHLLPQSNAQNIPGGDLSVL